MEKLTYLWDAVSYIIIGIAAVFNWQHLFTWPQFLFVGESFKSDVTWAVGMIVLVWQTYKSWDEWRQKRITKKLDQEIKRRRLDEADDIANHLRN